MSAKENVDEALNVLSADSGSELDDSDVDPSFVPEGNSSEPESGMEKNAILC